MVVLSVIYTVVRLFCFLFFLFRTKAGEGRICIIAAREFGVRRAIGVEIEGHLIEQVRFSSQCGVWNHT